MSARHWLTLALLTLSACAAPRYDDPIPVMTNRELSPDRRMEAARQAEARFPNDPRRISALNSLLWDRGFPHEHRRYAFDQLVAIDEAGFRPVLARRIVLIENPETVQYIYDQIVARGWGEFTPVLVRQWCRPVKGVMDAERSEKQALEKLNPGKTAGQVVLEVFADADDSIPVDQQAAAWELLCRITPPGELMSKLAAAPDSTPMVIDLKACASELHTLPRNREGVLWLGYLRDPARKPEWEAYRSASGRLSDHQREGLELRHLPVLPLLDDATLSADRATLLQQVGSVINAAEHHLEGPTYDGPMNDWPQRFNDWSDQLSWADLATLRLLMRAVADRSVASSLFTQADQDKTDTSTEHGGVIDHAGNGFVATAHPPAIRRHDLKYYPPQAMIEQLYTGLAHYHFHAQEYRNSRYAGPGLGDKENADRLPLNFLVLTFIDRDTLNVDFYRRGGVVLDLGVIRR